VGVESTGSGEVWSSFTYDPRDPQFAPLRASDRDRSLAQQVIADAYADGRLDRGEFDERSDRVTRVRVLGDLGPLLWDLVAPPAPAGRGLTRATRADLEVMAVREWRAKRREAAYSFLGASLLTTAIWFATSWRHGDFDPYFFWPAFVIVLSFLNLVRTATSRSDIVESEVRRLERRREKELRSRPRRDRP
jgi:hypothetical protein